MTVARCLHRRCRLRCPRVHCRRCGRCAHTVGVVHYYCFLTQFNIANNKWNYLVEICVHLIKYLYLEIRNHLRSHSRLRSTTPVTLQCFAQEPILFWVDAKLRTFNLNFTDGNDERRTSGSRDNCRKCNKQSVYLTLWMRLNNKHPFHWHQM